MKKYFILLCTMAFLSSLHITAQSFRKEIYARPELSANNYLAYPTPSGKLTLPPTDYVPGTDLVISFTIISTYDLYKHLRKPIRQVFLPIKAKKR